MDIVYLIKSQVRRSFSKIKYLGVCETLKDAESRVDAYNETNSVETLRSMSHMPYEMFHRMESNDKSIFAFPPKYNDLSSRLYTSELARPTALLTATANKPADKPMLKGPPAITQLKLVLNQQASPDGLGEPTAVGNIRCGYVLSNDISLIAEPLVDAITAVLIFS